jgi:virginiamycin A acetyltransferase
MVYREVNLFSRFLLAVYNINNRYLRKIIRQLILSRKGAEFYSKTIRIIFHKYNNVKIGLYSYGVFKINLPPGTLIGRYASVAQNLSIINGSHPIANKSTHPFFYNPYFGYVDSLLITRRTKLIIGNDVYIGLNVTILPSVTSIGDGSVIAAGSVVVKNVPPFAIVGGNPAQIIRYRFNQKTINKIAKSAWWEKDIEELKADELKFASFLKPFK